MSNKVDQLFFAGIGAFISGIVAVGSFTVGQEITKHRFRSGTNVAYTASGIWWQTNVVEVTNAVAVEWVYRDGRWHDAAYCAERMAHLERTRDSYLADRESLTATNEALRAQLTSVSNQLAVICQNKLEMAEFKAHVDAQKTIDAWKKEFADLRRVDDRNKALLSQLAISDDVIGRLSKEVEDLKSRTNSLWASLHESEKREQWLRAYPTNEINRLKLDKNHLIKQLEEERAKFKALDKHHLEHHHRHER